MEKREAAAIVSIAGQGDRLSDRRDKILYRRSLAKFG
jgi:hypothetical protein